MRAGVCGCVRVGLCHVGVGGCLRALCTCNAAAGECEHAPRRGVGGAARRRGDIGRRKETAEGGGCLSEIP